MIKPFHCDGLAFSTYSLFYFKEDPCFDHFDGRLQSG